MEFQTLETARITGLHKEELTAPQPCGPGGLNRMMQQATEHGMQRLGVSVEELMGAGLLWVICFSQINVKRMPCGGESVSIYTWPGAEKMGMFTRRYAAFTQEGEELFTAASLFSLVNETTRALVLPADSGFIFPVVNLPDEPKLPRFSARGTEGNLEISHPVTSDEIDKNGHVNNAFYLDWAEEVRQKEALSAPDDVTSIWIGYSKEVLQDQLVTMRYGCNEQELFLRGYVNGESCFTIVFG